jgi:2-polyprenyl-3-methyl-5-hydroxy-6-metoxy-1,4-benzoquinol methylase
VNPIPEENQLNQDVEESDAYTQDQLSKVEFFRKRAVRLFERVERIIPPGRVLDIGCAIGTELVVARERGWEGTGIELSRSSVEIANRDNLHVFQRSLEDCSLAENSYDLITANHVLEHVAYTEPFFHNLNRILCKKGLLFISVPNVNAWWRFLLGERYSWTFHDDHFIHFSRGTLSLMLKKHGFKILEIYSSRWRDFHDDLSKHSLRFRVTNDFIEKLGLGIELFCLAQLAR